MNNDLFRLIIRQCSLLPLGGDLLSSLSGTPAGEQLQKNIDYYDNEYEKDSDMKNLEQFTNRKKPLRKEDKAKRIEGNCNSASTR